MIEGRKDATRGSGRDLTPRTRVLRRVAASGLAAALLLVAGTATLQDAAANADTRTLDLYHEHTRESASITYRRGGQYDPQALRQLNWFLRDWRIDEQTRMDPKLFDIVWQVHREARATGPIHVASAYRSPETNAALRRRSRGVAEHSQHMRGKAMDFFLHGVSMARVREIGVRLQHGGVGFYPHSKHQFVHLDAGGVRSWPRLPDAQLARLFPDGRTVHIPTSGQPMTGYEEAKAAILARGGTVGGVTAIAEGGRQKSLWARLFGGEDEDEDLAAPDTRMQVASAGGNEADGGMRAFLGLFGSSPAAMPAADPPPSAPESPAPAAAAVREPASAAIAMREPMTTASVAHPLPPRRPAELTVAVKGAAFAMATTKPKAPASPRKEAAVRSGPEAKRVADRRAGPEGSPVPKKRSGTKASSSR